VQHTGLNFFHSSIDAGTIVSRTLGVMSPD